jgi:hypothetical protein
MVEEEKGAQRAGCGRETKNSEKEKLRATVVPARWPNSSVFHRNGLKIGVRMGM